MFLVRYRLGFAMHWLKVGRSPSIAFRRRKGQGREKVDIFLLISVNSHIA